MNQDMLKEKLLLLAEPKFEFSLVFTGKKSKRVHGLYKPETREILIHNRNFAEDAAGENMLVYTAIHEFAHHLQAERHGGKISARAHTTEFWAIFHGLLEKAEAVGVYHNTAADNPDLAALTQSIREKFILKNGELFKEFGAALKKAFDLCAASGVRFEDYIDRVLRIPRASAQLAVKAADYDLNPALGSDNMRYLAAISNEDKREEAAENFAAGKSPDMVRMQARSHTSEPPDEHTRLEKEKQRLERTIAALEKRLEEVNASLEAA